MRPNYQDLPDDAFFPGPDGRVLEALAKAGQARRVERRASKEADLGAADVFYILWNPDYSAPPTTRFRRLADAERAARLMAKQHAPHRFYICAAVSVAKAAETPVELTPLKKAGGKR